MLVAVGREGQQAVAIEPSQLSAVRTGPAVVSRQKPKYSKGREWRCLESAGVSFGDAIGCPGKGLGLKWGR